MTRLMRRLNRVRLLISLGLLVALLGGGPACGPDQAPDPPGEVSKDPTPSTDAGGPGADAALPDAPPLMEQWRSLCRDAGLEATGLAVSSMALTLDDAGRIVYLSGKFHPRPEGDDSCFRLLKTPAVDGVRIRTGETMGLLGEDGTVPLQAVLTCIEDLRAAPSDGAAGASAGDYRPQGADYFLSVGLEDGLVVPTDNRALFVLSPDGAPVPISLDSALRVAGRIAVLQATTTQGMGSVGTSGERETRTLLLAEYCGTMEDVGWIDLPPSRVDGRTLGLKWADFDGDGDREFVYLCGQPGDEGDTDLHLVVSRSADGGGERIPLPNAGPTNDNTFLSRDLTGDGLPELILWQKLFQGGELHYLGVYGLNAGGRGLQGLFTSDGRDGCDVQREYLGDGLVRIGAGGRVWEFDLADVRGAGVTPEYEEAARRGLGPEALGPFVGFTFADTDGDGTVEVVGHQCVYGIDGSDSLANLRQVYRWDAAAGTFAAAGVELYSARFGVRLEPRP